MLNSMQSDVLQFHRFFGLNWPSRPQDISPERRSLRRSLIAEENSELWLAVSRFDMFNSADGICDLLYVTLGTRVEFGLPSPAAVKLHPRPAIGFPEKKEMENAKSVFVRALSLLSLALARGDKLSEIDHHTTQVARNAAALSAAFGLPLLPLWNEVHASNMTKAERDAHGEDCPLTRAPQTALSSACSCGAVLYREDGKLLKGKNFRPPALAPILAACGYVPPEAPHTLFTELVAGMEKKQ